MEGGKAINLWPPSHDWHTHHPQILSTPASEVSRSGHQDAVPSAQLQEKAQTGAVKLGGPQAQAVDTPLHPSHGMTPDRRDTGFYIQ